MNREVRNMRLDLIASCSFSLFYLLFSLSFFAFLNIARKKKEKKEHIVEQTLNENVPLSCFSIYFFSFISFISISISFSFISIPFVLPVHSNTFEFHLVRQ